MTPPPKVIYIVGLFRSGTTVLGDLLGQVEGCFHLGELRQLWVTPRLPKARCGCGARIGDCGTWRAILSRAFDGDFGRVCTHMLEDERAGLRSRDALLLARFPWLRRLYRKRLSAMRRYTGTLHALYAAAAAESGRMILVDSSKWPAIAYALGDEPGIEYHIVRDARAVTHSWGAGWRRLTTCIAWPALRALGYLNRSG